MAHPRVDGVLNALVFAFVILALFGWAAAIWIQPAGPGLWGVNFAPIAGVVVLVSLLLLALAFPRPKPRSRDPETVEADARHPRSAGTLFAFGAVFWILVVAAFGTALLGDAVL